LKAHFKSIFIVFPIIHSILLKKIRFEKCGKVRENYHVKTMSKTSSKISAKFLYKNNQIFEIFWFQNMKILSGSCSPMSIPYYLKKTVSKNSISKPKTLGRKSVANEKISSYF
jgi:hypothetical protein